MKVLILGCGWVGEEFAHQMIALGAEVWASVTSREKADRLISEGIRAFVLDFDNDLKCNDQFPLSIDYVLTSVPATSKYDISIIQYRFDQVYGFLEKVSYTKHIFLSSIGVYPDIDFTFDENYEVDSIQRLAVAENRLQQLPNTIIYRLGGLFGKNRIFAKYFQNRVCTTGNQPANFVNLDDVVQLISKGFMIDLNDKLYNIVAPEHPTKKEVILASAQKYGFDEPSSFQPENSFQKIVSGSKIIAELGYNFKFPSPLNF